jgi:aryl-alcohol dehydrogenase-like predicted oxidoreductase
MKRKKLPSTELQISPICLGMMSYGSTHWQPWVLDANAGLLLVEQALIRGINFFDTADFYSFGQSEKILGTAINRFARRNEVVIATKVGLPVGGSSPQPGGLHPDYVAKAADASLKRLGVDHIDIYQLHGWDPDIPIAETMGAMETLVEAGKIRHVGVSNFTPAQFAAASCATGQQVISVQSQYNLLYRGEEQALLRSAHDQRIGFIAFSPLARGRLGGLERRTRSRSEAARAAMDSRAKRIYGRAGKDDTSSALRHIATTRGEPSASLALSWVMRPEGATAALIGATEVDHLDHAVRATQILLRGDEMALLDQGYVHRPLELNDLSGGLS